MAMSFMYLIIPNHNSKLLLCLEDILNQIKHIHKPKIHQRVTVVYYFYGLAQLNANAKPFSFPSSNTTVQPGLKVTQPVKTQSCGFKATAPAFTNAPVFLVSSPQGTLQPIRGTNFHFLLLFNRSTIWNDGSTCL